MSDNKVKFGVLSTARIALKVIPAIQQSSLTECTLIVSRDLKRGEEFAAKVGVPNFSTFENVLQSDVNAFYIPLPSGVRNEWIIKAAQAGKHVYAEKPFSGSFNEVKSMIEVCNNNNVQFMDGTMWVHSTRTKEIEQRLKSQEIGAVRKVIAAFTFKGPSEEWLNGGDVRTNKELEPMGCFGDQGWYPVGAIMWAFNYERPTRVMMTQVQYNNIDTIINCSGIIWFSEDRMAFFDAGANLPHRSQFEIIGEKGVIKVNDLVGGQGRSGNFAAYEVPFVGSDTYIIGDHMGLDREVHVEACDHTLKLVEEFARCVNSGKVNPDWPRRTLVCYEVMCALFESAQKGCTVVPL